MDDVRLREASPMVPPQPSWVLDLGTGGGLPGLVLAGHWEACHLVLLDANERKTAFLEEAVSEIGLKERVEVLRERAEVAGRREGMRRAFDLVVARSFGPPPVTAECAAPFLSVGGLLVVSEPPSEALEGSTTCDREPRGSEGITGLEETEARRWPSEALSLLGLEPLGKWQRSAGFEVLRQASPCPERFPRRIGVAGKRPLYGS